MLLEFFWICIQKPEIQKCLKRYNLYMSLTKMWGIEDSASMTPGGYAPVCQIKWLKVVKNNIWRFQPFLAKSRHENESSFYKFNMRCIMLIREVLIHSRIREFLTIWTVTEKTENFLQILCSALKKSQEKLRLASCLEENEGLIEIVRLVYEISGTDMGNYWIFFVDMTDLLIKK